MTHRIQAGRMLAAVAIALALAAIGARPASAQADAAPVAVERAEREPIVNVVRLSGSVVAPRSARVSAAVGGLVERVRVALGDRVDKGDTLVDLNADLARHEAARARAALAEARAELATGLLVAGAVPGHAASLKMVSSPLPPYSMPDGPKRGFVAEIAKEIAQRVGAPAHLHYMPWARAYRATKRRSNRILAPVARAPHRESELTWLVRVYPERMSVFTHADHRGAARLEEVLEDGLVGVQRGSLMLEVLRRRGVDEENLLIQTRQVENAKLLRAGRIDAWLTHRSLAIHAMREAGLNPENLVEGEIVGRYPIYIGGSPDLPSSTVREWRRAFEDMQRDGTYDTIMARYGLRAKLTYRPPSLPKP